MVNLEQVNTRDSSKILFLLYLILGKTLLAKAVANQTSATFLRVVGSELIQKYLVNNFNVV
jgi:ATP-dependent 26S proteasome regulatory subunit